MTIYDIQNMKHQSKPKTEQKQILHRFTFISGTFMYMCEEMLLGVVVSVK